MRQKIPKTYFDPTRPHIRKIINPVAKKILNVGCGAGVLGHLIKQKQGAEVWGIESNRLLVDYARSKIDKVICCSYEDSISSLPDNFFDTIVFENLEQAVHPHTLLISMKCKLTSGGEIIASITNVRQWSIIRDLVQGCWNYDYYGTMDRKNLRFFTRNSIIALFQNAGYYLVNIKGEDVAENRIPEDVLQTLSRTGIDTSTLERESGLFQFFVKGIIPLREKSALHRRAESLLEKGQHMIAEDIYLSHYAEAPYSIETLYGLALCSLKRNSRDSALQYLKKVIEIEPGHSGVYNQIGIICRERRDLETARSLFFEAIMKSPHFVEAKRNYGEVLVELGHFKEGVLVFKNILRTAPDDVKTLFSLAQVYKQMGDISNAICFSKKVLDLDTNFEEAARLFQTLKGETRDVSLTPDRLIHHIEAAGPCPSAGRGKSSGIGRFLLNSIPKGGSNLLSKIVDMFPGIDFSKIVIAKPDYIDELPMGDLGVLGVGRDGYLGNLPKWDSPTKVPVGVDWPIMEDLDKIFFILSELRDGAFATGHIPYSEELARLVLTMEIKTFLVLRDPRDVVVSHALFVSENPYNTCYELYRNLSTEERIMTSIVGIEESEDCGIKLLSIKERIESLLPWTSNSDNCTLFFERLVGPKGRGSHTLQLKELNKIAVHLGFNCSHQELEDLANKVFGGTETFRTGIAGGWKTYMSDEHKEVCKELIGEILIDLGYEKDYGW